MAKKRSGTPRSADSVLGVPSLGLALGILKRLPGAHAAAASNLFADGSFRLGSSARVDPNDFVSHEEFARALLSVSLLRKYPGFPGNETKKLDAIAKWTACEDQCRITNERFKEFRIGLVRPDLHEPFRLARKKIQKLLGPFRWSKVAKFFNFGPGSTTRLPYARRHLPFKYGENPETTLDNLASASAVIGLSPLWTLSTGGRYIDDASPCFRIREESKITTVPKDAFIDRVIAIEPDMNMFVQKGFGGYMRRRLKAVGVNLDDQSLNQLLARQGSLGGLATLDLSSASDTVAYELVRELMPIDWFEALLSCRAHASRLPSGEVTNLQKFSSMGNGFTFELESLIFWALCSSVCTETVGREGLHASVYGDDIIVSVVDYPAVVDLLEFAGFTVNTKKSFCSGPYRESCGKHYFHGHDVTPVTITKEITNVSQLLLICNNLQRWALRNGRYLYRDSFVYESFRYAVGHLPDHFRRPKLPDGYGDGALIGPFDVCRPQRCRRGWDGWRVPGVLLPKRNTRRSSGVHTLTASLAELERSTLASPAANTDVYQDIGGASFRADDLVHPVSTRDWALRVRLFGGTSAGLARIVSEASEGQVVSKVGEVDSAKLGKVFVKQWCDIGPWVP